MADNAEPALTITQGLSAIVMPPKILGFVLTLQFKLPNPVAPAVGFNAQAAPTQTVLLTELWPTSNNSVSDDGEVAIHPLFVKFEVEVDVTLEQLPNIIIAAFEFAVVMDGIFESDVDVAVYHDVAVVTSKGVVVFTPEKATIAPATAVEPVVTVNV